MQTERSAGLTLMLDYGLFYEFVPLEDLDLARPRRHTVADVELDRPYAVVLTTPAGLWSYILGDTVRFTARDPCASSSPDAPGTSSTRSART